MSIGKKPYFMQKYLCYFFPCIPTGQYLPHPPTRPCSYIQQQLSENRHALLDGFSNCRRCGFTYHRHNQEIDEFIKYLGGI